MTISETQPFVLTNLGTSSVEIADIEEAIQQSIAIHAPEGIEPTEAVLASFAAIRAGAKTVDQATQEYLAQVRQKMAANTDTQQGSTPKQEEASRSSWLHKLGLKMVEANQRMETDPEYLKYIQSITR